MTDSPTFSEYYALTYRVIHRQVEGVTDEESLIQPPFRGNCMNWVIGHIVASRERVLKLLGAQPTWTIAEAGIYAPNSEPVTSGKRAIPLTHLLRDLETSQQRLLAALQQVAPETLAARADEEETVGQQITFSHWHETYHVGQLELLRQLAGKNDKVI
jgi:DinB superfamily